jgi:Rap1a immunity proteins
MYERYWRSIAIAIFTSLQLTSGAVGAEENPYTANDLLQDCKASLLEGVAVPRPFYSNSGLCMGLVAGVHYIDAKSCAPDNATNNQLMRVVLAYIEVRPQRMNEEFMKLVVEALRSAWPCSNP